MDNTSKKGNSTEVILGENFMKNYIFNLLFGIMLLCMGIVIIMLGMQESKKCFYMGIIILPIAISILAISFLFLANLIK